MSFSDIPQPGTYDERCALARRLDTELTMPGVLLVDTMDDASRTLFGDLPTPAMVIDRRGIIRSKLPWAEPDVLRPRLKRIADATYAPPQSSREAAADAVAALYVGRPDRAAPLLDTVAGRPDLAPGLRPLVLRASAACHPVGSPRREQLAEQAVTAARKALTDHALRAALSEIHALTTTPRSPR